MKRLYVSFIRLLRLIFRAFGGLGFLEKRMEHSLWARWFRSLFAIYDFDDLAKLDLPWWSLEAATWVDGYLSKRKGVRVFEYGSGASTLWLSSRCSSVITIEHDMEWAGVVEGKFAPIANITFKAIPPAHDCPEGDVAYLSDRGGWQGRSFKAYAKAIEAEGGPFDVIVIDGRVRAACLKEAIRFLAEDGIIIFDNAGRARYQQALEHSGMETLRFSGLTACLPYPDQTFILRKASS